MRSKAKLFILDDDELILTVLSKSLKKEGYEIYAESDSNDVIEKIRSWDPDVVMLDKSLPGRDGIDILRDIKGGENPIDTQVVMLTADESAETAVKAMKLGAVDYVTKPFNTDEVKMVLANVLERENLRQEVKYLRKAYSQVIEKDFIGESPAIVEIKATLGKIAAAQVSAILITGESGTGKEVVARYIHRLMFGGTPSRHAPFVSINCAAMPATLLESELFGHEKGAFTDAKTDKKGLFEQANGGVILLDEIGDMEPGLQSKLLRILENRTVRRIGGNKEIPVDVTAIASTSRNLSQAVEKGEFRKALFFRLSPFYIHIPPLRERKEDIPLLARHFLSHFANRYNKRSIKGFSPEAEQIMSAHGWPGNARELKNLVERFVVLEDSEMIRPEHMPSWVFGHSMGTAQPSGSRFLLPETGLSLEELEKDLIIQALDRTGNNKAQAAKLLGVSYDSLRYQLKKFGLG